MSQQNSRNFVNADELRSRLEPLLDETFTLYLNSRNEKGEVSIPADVAKTIREKWSTAFSEEKKLGGGDEVLKSVIGTVRSWSFVAVVNTRDITAELVGLILAGDRDVHLVADWKAVHQAILAKDPSFKALAACNREEGKRFLKAYDFYYKEEVAKLPTASKSFFSTLAAAQERSTDKERVGDRLRTWVAWTPDKKNTKKAKPTADSNAAPTEQSANAETSAPVDSTTAVVESVEDLIAAANIPDDDKAALLEVAKTDPVDAKERLELFQETA
jgi:hypothetical protein